MKKLSTAVLATVLATILAVPASSFAWGGPYYGRRVVRHFSYNGGAIAAGVLGGLATGIILDRVLFPPLAPVYYPEPAYYPPPPPPAPRDPYDSGYSDGYSRGIERGRYERYQQGRDRGYHDGYEDSRSGRY